MSNNPTPTTMERLYHLARHIRSLDSGSSDAALLFEAVEENTKLSTQLNYWEANCKAYSERAKKAESALEQAQEALRRMKKGSDGLNMDAIAAFREAIFTIDKVLGDSHGN
jgi:hypothetical protein